MAWFNLLPWRYMVSRVAKHHGYLDPLALADRLLKFAQPSEVDIPLELMRAGAVFHARGLINSRVIQHNLDWVWPYWAEKQFDPRSTSFVPRAFSVTHVNLTHRNWTAIGRPDFEELPIIDPCGLLTPFWDGWSLDAWLLTEDGYCMLPQRTKNVDQRLDISSMQVITEIRSGGLSLHSAAGVDDNIANDAQSNRTTPTCYWQLQAQSNRDAWLVVSLRPQNPEGVSFVHQVELLDDNKTWLVEDKYRVMFDTPVERHHVSDYRHGDVHIHLQDREQQKYRSCEVGMVTAAALFKLSANQTRKVRVAIPLTIEHQKHSTIKQPKHAAMLPTWKEALNNHCQLRCPDQQIQFLFDAAIRSLILLSPSDVYPGPYTYKRFWFRDSAFLIDGLLCSGLEDRAKRALLQFPERQDASGYFCSQEGEWDSNGEVLWVLKRLQDLTGKTLAQHFPDTKKTWYDLVRRGADWIIKKRVTDKGTPHAGLLPPGFSAEHLGPNDYYYWDNYWGIAGLRAAATLIEPTDVKRAIYYREQADQFLQAVEQSISACSTRLRRLAIPASPYRRLDAGAIGSIVAGYPLQLYSAHDARLLDTIEFLLDECFVNDAFFQDMIHSGLNAYLTLEVAQVLLRAGDQRHVGLMQAVADLASPTGQWPEAIHPHTFGGCMGDGHHGWASTEWILFIRNCFLREERGELILCSGIPRSWLQQNNVIEFGPAPTAFGPVTLSLTVESTERVSIHWQADWFDQAPNLQVQLPGYQFALCSGDKKNITVERSRT